MRNLTASTLTLTAAACLGASIYFMFQAGCAGDLKGGALGNPTLALQFESKGVAFGLLAVAGVASVAALGRDLSLVIRAARCLAVALFAWAVVTYIGIDAEIWGVQSCWSKE